MSKMSLSVVTFDFGFLSVITFSKTKPNQAYLILGSRLIEVKTIENSTTKRWLRLVNRGGCLIGVSFMVFN